MKYDADYYYNLLRLQTEHGQRIAETRWRFISEIRPRFVLDYGCGVGFFKAFAPPHIHVDTFDVGPFTQTGIRRDAYDVVCLWDVLEHIPHIDKQLKKLFDNSSFIAMTVPMLPDDKDLKSWKHYKPGEHLHYFGDEDLDVLFDYVGYKRRKSGYPECPPREDIESILYEKR